MTTFLGVSAMYIDGVFSGGGIKGIALIGACEELEKRGYQFQCIAGTSAGAIIAGLIAANYTSKEINLLIDELDLSILLDGRRQSFLPFAVTKWIFLFWRLGLYKGEALEHWLEGVLAKKGIKTFSDLPPNKLRLIASDITHGRMITLPDDLSYYGINPESFSVAKAIRMSCSIPYFFEPVRLKSDNHTNILVDGGVLSNFPIWLFEENGKRKRPLIGLKLSHEIEERPINKINNAIQLFGALFETMKDAHDARHISSRYEDDIIFIPTSGISPTEFSLTEEKKQLLIQNGKECAEKFLSSWRHNKRINIL